MILVKIPLLADIVLKCICFVLQLKGQTTLLGSTFK